jgi:hypothetical protein
VYSLPPPLRTVLTTFTVHGSSNLFFFTNPQKGMIHHKTIKSHFGLVAPSSNYSAFKSVSEVFFHRGFSRFRKKYSDL